MGDNILMIIAPKKFRDEEYLVPKKFFVKMGFNVVTACVMKEPANGMLGAVVTPDVLVKDVQPANYVATVFVGGGGAGVYFNDATIHNLVHQTLQAGQVLGAICIAPVILANAGVLENKDATVFQSGIAVLKKNHARYISADVVTDGRIVTANGPQAAKGFAKKVVELLSKKI
ncbi:MAG: DJ-1/PfpI family protein [Elusimicrobiota bacterium]